MTEFHFHELLLYLTKSQCFIIKKLWRLWGFKKQVDKKSTTWGGSEKLRGEAQGQLDKERKKGQSCPEVSWIYCLQSEQ